MNFREYPDRKRRFYRNWSIVTRSGQLIDISSDENSACQQRLATGLTLYAKDVRKGSLE